MPAVAESLEAAIQHHEAGRLDQAEALFVKVTELRPDSPAGYWGLGIIHLLRGQPEAAKTALSSGGIPELWVGPAGSRQ